MSGDAMVVFATEEEARDAYYSEDGSGLDDEDAAGEGWDDPEQIDELGYTFDLLRQEETDGDRTRYFVVGAPEGAVVALRDGGGEVEIGETDTFDDLPSYDDEDSAREAFDAWLDAYDGAENMDEEGNLWTEWEVVDEVDPWYVFGRFREDGEEAEYIIAGVDGDGAEVYLHPGASIDDEAYIYTDEADVQDALADYFEAVDEGAIDESRQPTGEQPSDGAITGQGGQPGQGEGPASQRGGLLRTVAGVLLGNPLLTVSIVVLAVLIYRRHGDRIRAALSRGRSNAAAGRVSAGGGVRG